MISSKKGGYHMEYIWIILLFIFYSLIIIAMTNYIFSSIFFILPMKKKYKILASDIQKDNIKDRYGIILFHIFTIVLYFFILLKLNATMFFIVLAIYALLCLYYKYKYNKYDIIEYVNYFSKDLFDWDKIYNLNIDENIKKQCFYIHYLNYDKYK